MIVGISGAQSTGKTTIVNSLEQLGYDVRKLVARTVMQEHPINQDGDDGTQYAIINTHLTNLDTANDVSFMDRCLVDGFVFTLYGARHGKVSAQCLEKIYEDFYNNINSYDYLVYLEPEFAIVPDGVRALLILSFVMNFAISTT